MIPLPSQQTYLPPQEAMQVPQPAPTSMLEVIARVASDPNADVDKLERLLAMKERLDAQSAKVAYATALAQLQPRLPILKERGGIKDRGGNVQSKYALWEDIVGQITPLLSEHGFSLSFRTSSDASGITVTGVLAHQAGHSEQTSLTLPADASGSKNAVQAIGSSTSYGKRYTASALLNLRSGEPDDDGKSGGGGMIDEQQAADLYALAHEVGKNLDGWLKKKGHANVMELSLKDYRAVVAGLESLRRTGEDA